MMHSVTVRAASSPDGRSSVYQTMLLNGTLTRHLQEISEMASRRLGQMMPQMAKSENVTEDLKAHDPMSWTQQMNCLKAQAEELLLTELIYS